MDDSDVVFVQFQTMIGPDVVTIHALDNEGHMWEGSLPVAEWEREGERAIAFRWWRLSHPAATRFRVHAIPPHP